MDTKQFFAALFGDVEDGAIATWSKGGGSSWYKAPIDAAQMHRDARKQALKHDMYYNVCVQEKPLTKSKRGDISGVKYATTLWVDLDCAKDGAVKPYFPTKKSAMEFLDNLPLKYSIVVDSGGGYHAYWLFDEVFIIENDDDRRRLEAASYGWQGFMRKRAQELGYAIDSTHDLARVLRVPGTRNHKHAATVEVVRKNERRYSLDDFEEYAVEAPRSDIQQTLNLVNVHRDMAPPFGKFDALCANDQDFERTWKRKRKDLPDQSASSYCFSLADTTAKAGWSDDEITALLVAFRNKEPDADPYIDRPEWYARTIAKIRATSTISNNIEQLNDIKQEQGTRGVLATISKALGLNVYNIIKYRPESNARYKDKPSYELDTEKGRVLFDSASDLMTFRNFQTRIMEEFDIILSPIKGVAWQNLLQAMIDSAQHELTASEGSEYEAIRTVIETMTSKNTTDDVYTAHSRKITYQDPQTGDLFFSWDELYRTLKVDLGMKIGNRRLSSIIEAIGCEKVKFNNIPIGNNKLTSITLWKTP